MKTTKARSPVKPPAIESAPTTAPATSGSKLRIFLWLLVGMGILARLWLWWISIGSNDVQNWVSHATRVAENGLVHTYTTHLTFNHPPIMGLYSSWAWSWAGGDLWAFARFIKIPGLIGEGLVIWALLRHKGLAYSAAYACLPAPILISAYHGNTDTLCGAFALLSALYFDRKRFLAAGLFIGAALNVKLMAVVLVPVLAMATPSWLALRNVSLGLAASLMVFLPSAMQAPREMYRNMLAYGSNPDNWGVLAILNASAATPNTAALGAKAREHYLTYGRYLMLFGILATSTYMRWKRAPFVQQAAVAVALFLVLAPGFGIQYLGFVTPLILAADLKIGTLWGWVSGIFAALVYWIFMTSSSVPVASVLTVWYPGPAPLIGILAWGVLIYFVWKRPGSQKPEQNADIEQTYKPARRALIASVGRR